MSFTSTVAFGDGCFVWRKGADLNDPNQKAIIYWKDNREVLILQVKYEGQAEDFAWIVPLPSQPKVDVILSEKSPFAEISLYTQLRSYWGTKGRMAEEVIVLERKTVGVYDVSVLSARDADTLNKWLNKNGYTFPAERNDLLQHYMKKNWIYVAMRIDPNALQNDEIKKLKVGELQPIRFEFSTNEMVYPLKISSVNTGETELLLYVLAKTPMTVNDPNTYKGLSIEQNFGPFGMPFITRYTDIYYGTYRKVEKKELPLTWEAIGAADNVKLSLCKYRAIYTSRQITDDLTFVRFEPVLYWEKRFSKEPNIPVIEFDRQRAFTVLAWHNPTLLKEFAEDKHPENRRLAAEHPKTSESIMLMLTKDTDLFVRLALTYNTNSRPDVLRELSKDENESVRSGAALHPNTPPDAIAKLVKDKSARIRRSVVHHPSVTTSMLHSLSKDDDEYVRASTVYDQRTSMSILKRLARDKSSHVRNCVAMQSRLPASLLEKLAHDSSADVRKTVAFSTKTPVKTLVMLANDEDAIVRSGAARNSRTPVELLKKLAKDKERAVRSSVAENSNVPEDFLVSLADDSEYWVRFCVANNPQTPIKVLLKLSEDKDLQVSYQAKQSLKKRQTQ